MICDYITICEIPYPTVTIGRPMNEESIARVEIVKLCCPLNHFVTSQESLQIVSFDNPRSCIREYIRSEMAKERSVSSCRLSGIGPNISSRDFFVRFITQISRYSLLHL